MMRLCALAISAALLTVNPAVAEQFQSKTFKAAMACEAESGLASIEGNHCPVGETCPYCPTGRDCPLIEPWEPTPIRIVGVELLLIAGEPTWAFAGNAAVPDVMMMMGHGQTRVQQWFPSGLSFTMPATGKKGTTHIDLHVAYDCGVFNWRKLWRRAHFFYTIYYTVEPSPNRVSAN